MSWTTGRSIWVGVIAAITICIYNTTTYAAIPPGWVPKWEEDLRFAQAQAAEQHPNLFHHITQEQWESAFDTLVTQLPTLEHYEIAVALAAIVARVQDGHTRLTLPLGPDMDFMQGHSNTPDPKVDALLFHQFPVRFFIDGTGVYIREIDVRHAAAVGSRVVKIGSLSTDDAIAAVSPTVRHDNEMQLLYHLPMHLVLAEILCACGVIRDTQHLTIEVASAKGGTDSIELTAVPHGQTVEWTDARSTAPAPLYLRNTDENVWFTRIEDSPVLYVQFNEVYDGEEESLGEFADRLGQAIANQQIGALIVDLRNNRGGDASLSLPLLHAILCSKVNEAGKLFTLVGRTTFSAAMMFALDLERHTETLFVGEPTGSTPNHYGDSRKILLPNTGLTLRVSTRYHQNDFTDNRPWIVPHLPAPLTMSDYVNGSDPAVEVVRAIVADRSETRPVAGQWEGRVSIGLNTVDAALSIDDAGGGAIRIPDFDFEAPLEDLQTTVRRVSFQIEDERGPIHFDAAVRDHWMTGVLGSPSRHYPFILQRVE